MQSTTFDTNLITSTPDELPLGGTPEQKKKVTKQIRFIKDLYQKFPLAVVAGGAPLNHFHCVAAKDIDIYVATEKELTDIILEYTPDYVKSLGNNEYHSVTSNLSHVFEAVVSYKKDRFLVNIMVQPELSLFPTRLERVNAVISRFTYTASMMYYCEILGKLCMGRQYGNPLPNYRPHDKYSKKLLSKLLALSANSQHVWAAYAVTHRAQRSPNILTAFPLANHIFHYITTQNYVAKRSASIPVPNTINRIPFLTLRAYAMLDTDENLYTKFEEKYNELNAQTQAPTLRSELAPPAPTELPPMPTGVWSELATSTRPLSPHWLNTRIAVSQLQPSGGTNQEVAHQYHITGERAAALRRAWESLQARLR